MSKVQMDTEEVREFVNHLERFKELLNDEVNGLNSHFHNWIHSKTLGETNLARC
ncbi:hypothetical protein HpBT014_07160 [Helicobacter pylori]